ncbi:MAG: hypothetical protein E2O61_04330 [Gammaproteobacteria bacterium]|nr:MAG: hypothetical protein E2O59_00480 [Gammaproteobacteria bacterium]TDJ38496.1 MAG: hypothetical protein E2O61_04330 [Gammaproteobacteria bacterium]
MPQYTELEKGAALAEAAARIDQWRVEYKFTSLGFAYRLRPLEVEIRYEMATDPAIKAAWNAIWEGEDDEPLGFHKLVHEIFIEE